MLRQRQQPLTTAFLDEDDQTQVVEELRQKSKKQQADLEWMLGALSLVVGVALGSVSLLQQEFLLGPSSIVVVVGARYYGTNNKVSGYVLAGITLLYLVLSMTQREDNDLWLGTVGSTCMVVLAAYLVRVEGVATARAVEDLSAAKYRHKEL